MHQKQVLVTGFLAYLLHLHQHISICHTWRQMINKRCEQSSWFGFLARSFLSSHDLYYTISLGTHTNSQSWFVGCHWFPFPAVTGYIKFLSLDSQALITCLNEEKSKSWRVKWPTYSSGGQPRNKRKLNENGYFHNYRFSFFHSLAHAEIKSINQLVYNYN
jgi:hypothetical protein